MRARAIKNERQNASERDGNEKEEGVQQTYEREREGERERCSV